MPAPRLHPVQRPVAFADEDVARADRLIDTFGRLAAAAVPGAPVDERRLVRLLALTMGANHLLAKGEAKDGVRIDQLARGANYSSDKHIREGIKGSWPRRWSALAVRLLMASSAPLRAEHLGTDAARVRRESNFIGFDRHTDCGKVKPLLNLYFGAVDRHLLGWQIPLTTATSCDRTDAHADLERIAHAEAHLCEPLPATLAEHIELALAERELCRQLLRAALGPHGELFAEAGLAPGAVLADAFADLLVLEPLPHGAPRVAGETHGRLVMPGDRHDLWGIASGHGLAGIAARDPEAIPELALPPRPVELAAATIADWGLAANPWAIRFEAVGEDLLVRIGSVDGGTSATLWRVFGMPNDDQRALALAQRDAEDWPRACARRANAAAPPGRVYAKDPAFRMAVRALVRVADAARVTAERDRRAHELRR